MSNGTDQPLVDEIRVHAFEIPTDGPGGAEQDGTLEWDSTTIVLVEARSGPVTGLGYTYAEKAVATLVDSKLASLVEGIEALAPAAAWPRMQAALRNAGRPGAGAMAISAVDIALWDLKARLLGLPLVQVLPAVHEAVPVYGSGGFTNYPIERLASQLAEWVDQGIPRVKLKTSRNPEQDPERLTAVREAIGTDPEVFVDANGALTRRQALYWAERFAGDWDVRWFEEPVSSDDLEGLRLVRDRGPSRLEIAAGEYAFVPSDFARLMQAQAVDCLQADVTRCGGITGLLQVAGLSECRQVDLSAHCAPAVSAHAFCAVPRLRHLEYFHDHIRIESVIFDGTLPPAGGELRPDQSQAGLGLEVRWADAEPYRVHGSKP